jgi:hypothetical protein
LAFYFLNLLLIVYCGANLQLISLAMEYRSVKGFTGLGQLGILFVFLGAGFILAAGLQLIIGFQLIPSGLPPDKIGDAARKRILCQNFAGAGYFFSFIFSRCTLHAHLSW